VDIAVDPEAPNPALLIKWHNSDKNIFVTLHANGDVILWDLSVPGIAEQPLSTNSDTVPGRTVLREHDQICKDAAFSTDSTLLATAGTDGFVMVWQLDDNVEPQCVTKFSPHEGQPLRSVLFGGNLHHPHHQQETHTAHLGVGTEHLLITGAANNSELKLWNTKSWECLQRITLAAPPGMQVHLHAILDDTCSFLFLANMTLGSLYALRLRPNDNPSKCYFDFIREFDTTWRVLSFLCGGCHCIPQVSRDGEPDAPSLKMVLYVAHQACIQQLELSSEECVPPERVAEMATGQTLHNAAETPALSTTATAVPNNRDDAQQIESSEEDEESNEDDEEDEDGDEDPSDEDGDGNIPADPMQAALHMPTSGQENHSSMTDAQVPAQTAGASGADGDDDGLDDEEEEEDQGAEHESMPSNNVQSPTHSIATVTDNGTTFAEVPSSGNTTPGGEVTHPAPGPNTTAGAEQSNSSNISSRARQDATSSAARETVDMAQLEDALMARMQAHFHRQEQLQARQHMEMLQRLGGEMRVMVKQEMESSVFPAIARSMSSELESSLKGLHHNVTQQVDKAVAKHLDSSGEVSFGCFEGSYQGWLSTELRRAAHSVI